MLQSYKTNLRDPLPDILKGIAVIRMILVHLMQVFATQELYDSAAGKLIVFLFGPPGAPLFLVIMGYFVARSAKSFSISIYRGCKLFAWAILLNLGMNFHLLIRIINGSVQLNPWPYIFGADILFLAGFSMIIMAVYKKYFRDSVQAWILLFLLFTLAGLLIPAYSGDLKWPFYLQSFLTGHTHWSYFPVFPWAAYPVSGYIFSLLHKKYHLSEFTQKGLIYVASALLAIVAISFSWGFKVYNSFYAYHHHSLPFALWVLVLLSFWIIAIHLFFMNRKNLPVSRYFRWVGRYITNFYVFQWLLIGNIGTALYKTRQPAAIIVWFLTIVILTSLLVYIWRRIKQNI